MPVWIGVSGCRDLSVGDPLKDLEQVRQGQRSWKRLGTSYLD